jgi:hypothetical protein
MRLKIISVHCQIRKNRYVLTHLNSKDKPNNCLESNQLSGAKQLSGNKQLTGKLAAVCKNNYSSLRNPSSCLAKQLPEQPASEIQAAVLHGILVFLTKYGTRYLQSSNPGFARSPLISYDPT